MFSIFKKKQPKPDLAEHHDPSDMTKSKYSSHWGSDYYCKKCKCSVTARIELGGVCPGCGNVASCTDNTSWGSRGKRTLRVNGALMFQYQYYGKESVETKLNQYESFE